jgi:DNA-binding response OmpR family regulator
MTVNNKILVVDDDVPLAASIANLLTEAGYTPLVAHTAEDGFALQQKHNPALALLDVMVPIMGGLELCQEIRKASDIPIIFVTALGDVASVVKGLELGADDYLVKPYQPPVLLARIKAHLRRTQRNTESEEILSFANGDFVINLPLRQVSINGELVDLTPREYSLLLALAQNAGRVVTSTELTQIAWGLEEKNPRKTALKPYIHYLRKKVEQDPASPRWVLTARGVGYRFADE